MALFRHETLLDTSKLSLAPLFKNVRTAVELPLKIAPFIAFLPSNCMLLKISGFIAILNLLKIETSDLEKVYLLFFNEFFTTLVIILSNITKNSFANLIYTIVSKKEKLSIEA